MKKYAGYFLLAAIIAVGGFFSTTARVQAAGPIDCPTVMMGNFTNPGISQDPCWNNASSVSANPGDHVDVRLYYRNIGTAPSYNTMLNVTAPSGTATTQYLTGRVSGGGVSASGTGTVNLSTPAVLNFDSVYWYPNNPYNSNGQYVPNGHDIIAGGLNIGTINPPCANDADCHAGWVVVTFIVGSSQQSTCAISSFSANPSQISAGGSSTLSWNTTGCTSVTVSGPNVSSTQLSGSVPTGALAQTTNYTIQAAGPGAPLQTQTATVNVSGQQQVCAINSFYATPSSVSTGGSSTLSWNTSNCTGVTISGGNMSGNQALSGSASTGALSNTTTYLINATGTNSVSQSVTVSVAGGWMRSSSTRKNGSG